MGESWQIKTKCPCVVSKAIVTVGTVCCWLSLFFYYMQVCSRTLSSVPLLLSVSRVCVFAGVFNVLCVDRTF